MSTLREADCSLSCSSSATAVRCRVSPAAASMMTRCAAALIASGLHARWCGAGGESFNKREVPWKVTGPDEDNRVDLNAWQPHAAAMEAFHRGKQDATMVVYDDFERDEVPLSYFFRSPEEFSRLEQLALELCRGRVLDVGAGSGCHSLALQARGLEVTAIEILPSLVRVLQERGVKDARVATWMDVEAPPFDTVFMMMNGLGLTETLEGLRGFFRQARRLVARGGQVLADSTDVRARLDRDAGRTGALERPDGRYVGELHFQIEYEGRKGEPFPQLYVDANTLIRYAREEEWGCEIVRDADENGHYLARLTP